MLSQVHTHFSTRRDGYLNLKYLICFSVISTEGSYWQPIHFDLLYFSGLGEQNEEIRLTIDIKHFVC